MHASEPWFLYLTFNAVHGPLDADPARVARLTNYTYSTPDRRTEAAMTLALDDNVGLVLDTLQALNLATNTLVAFVNDNGGVSGRDNTQMRDFKGSLYEGGIRIPSCCAGPPSRPTRSALSGHHPGLAADAPRRGGRHAANESSARA
jgi:arylsulfatase A-like enzyme